MRRATLLGIVMGSLLIGSCATPMRQTDAPMVPYDRDTEYAVTPRERGFALTIYYSRYQFIPESSAVAIACKSALTSIAYEHAEKEGKRIQPLNEQRVRISMGRNGFTGMTSCSATTIAEWEDKMSMYPHPRHVAALLMLTVSLCACASSLPVHVPGIKVTDEAHVAGCRY